MTSSQFCNNYFYNLKFYITKNVYAKNFLLPLPPHPCEGDDHKKPVRLNKIFKKIKLLNVHFYILIYCIGNRNKRQLLETFVFCTKNGYKPRCPAGQTYKYFCRFQAKTCVYKIQCKRLSSHRGLDCNKAGVPAHVYNSEVCCTSSCS